jgi:hypothetical protein
MAMLFSQLKQLACVAAWCLASAVQSRYPSVLSVIGLGRDDRFPQFSHPGILFRSPGVSSSGVHDETSHGFDDLQVCLVAGKVGL